MLGLSDTLINSIIEMPTLQNQNSTQISTSIVVQKDVSYIILYFVECH